MYKVLIVDDEALVRIGLKTTIDWEELGFSIVADASNGEQAYQLYKKYKPDVIITDIRMPKKDGFYLIDKIRSKNKKSKILVLTVYDEFSYARKALKLGADDYILKTEIEDEELIELILKIKEELKKENFNKNNNNYHESENSIKKTLFAKIIRNDFELNKEIRKKFNSIDFPFKKGNYILANLVIEEKNKNLEKANYDKINNAVMNIIFDQFADKNIKYIYYKNHNSYIFLLSAAGIDNKNIKTLLKTICKAAKQYFDKNIKAIYSNIFNEFDDLYLNYKNIIEKNEILFYEKNTDLFIKKIDEIEFNNANIFEIGKEHNKKIEEAVIAKNVELLSEKITEVNSFFNSNNINPMEVKLFYSNLMTNIFNNFKTLLQSDEYLEEYENYYYTILNAAALKEIENLFFEFINMILSNLNNSKNNYSKILVDQALNFIESNYDQKISLENIADELSISKNYLCNVFKDETGENTTAYINKLRVEKAKQLLMEKNYKLKELYSKVGFSNQYYFSKVFKKISGMTVTEYKKIINNK